MKLTRVRQTKDSSISGQWVGATIEFTIEGITNTLNLDNEMDLGQLETALKNLINQFEKHE